jgi:hypothetical protein
LSRFTEFTFGGKTMKLHLNFFFTLPVILTLDLIALQYIATVTDYGGLMLAFSLTQFCYFGLLINFLLRYPKAQERAAVVELLDFGLDIYQ